MFTPNITPRQVIELGSFGGTYFDPKWAKENNYTFRDCIYKQLEGVSPTLYEQDSNQKYKKEINRYGVKVGQDQKAWENAGWIWYGDAETPSGHQRGMLEWYFCYSDGMQSNDDARQIQRWNASTGDNGRWKRRLIKKIYEQKADPLDESTFLVERQICQHWFYRVTEQDYDKMVRLMKSEGKL